MATAAAVAGQPAEELPTLFLSHGGGPMFFLDADPGSPFAGMARGSKAARWLQSELPPLLRNATSLLVVSAHYEERVATVTTHARPPLLFDYYGFPDETYRLTWPAPGSPALAARVRALLAAAGIASGEDASRGLDHGVFVPLKLALPDASLPVVQLSLVAGLDPAAHLAIGAALAPLRREGVLIVGSGFATHNLRAMRSGAPPRPGAPDDWLPPFSEWLAETLERVDARERVARLAATGARGARAPPPSFRLAHPREEHFTPLIVAAGAGAPEAVRAELAGAGAGAGAAGGAAVVGADGGADAAGAGGGAAAPARSSECLYSDVVPGVYGTLMAHYVFR